MEGHGAAVKTGAKSSRGLRASRGLGVQPERAAKTKPTQLIRNTYLPAPESAHLLLPFASCPGAPHRTRGTPILLPLLANPCKPFRLRSNRSPVVSFPDKSSPPTSQSLLLFPLFPAPLIHSLIVTLTIPDSDIPLAAHY